MKIQIETEHSTWRVERVPNWWCWMWARDDGRTAGKRETFWRIGPLHIQRFTARP